MARLCIGLLAAGVTSIVAMAMVSPEPEVAPPLRSHVGQFTFFNPPMPAPPLRLQALDGTSVELTQFRGKVVLLHLWATWCVLCVYELPALDRLAARRERQPFAIVALSADRDAERTVPPFLIRNNITRLRVYLDPAGAAPSAMPAYDLPASYLIDPSGMIVGYLPGMANWDSLEAQQLLDGFVSRATP